MVNSCTMSDRFWDKVEKTDECWVWTAAKTAGYGRFWQDGKMLNAHRVAYEMLVGPIPDGLQLDHLCRNRACVRPDHLEVVTQQENISRGDVGRHGNNANAGSNNREKTHCARGHEYTPENTYLTKQGPDGRQRHRNCRECQREANRRSYWKKKDKLST